jgi:hypothetical protein
MNGGSISIGMKYTMVRYGEEPPEKPAVRRDKNVLP